jgi:hypothetical protein
MDWSRTSDAKEQENWEHSPADRGRPCLQARGDVVPLYVFRTPEDTMTATTDNYMSIDVLQAEIRLANDRLSELAEQ